MSPPHSRVVEKFGESPVLLVAPHLAKLAPQLSGWNALLEMVEKFREIVLEHVNRHREEQNEDEIPRDFIDAFISTTDPSSSFYKDAGSKSLCTSSIPEMVYLVRIGFHFHTFY